MKTFKNQQTEIIQINEEKKELKMTFADLAMIVLNRPPQGGWTVEDMRERFKVISKMEKLKPSGKVELEDAEFKTLKKCSDVKWQMMHKDIIAFDEYLEEIEKQKDK